MTAHSGGTSATAGSSGMIAQAGAGGAAGAAAGHSAAGAGGASGASGGGGSGAGNGTMLTGTIGTLGAVKPTMAGWAITTPTNETAIYLSSAPLTCQQISTPGGRWLGSVTAGSQVIEIVIPGGAMMQTYQVGFLQAEVNFAAGGSSSATEQNSSSGSVTFTKAMPNGVQEGMVMATNSAGMLSGTFHAEWCATGQEY